ncbi:MAG: hypothetical protein H6502_00475 [Candidatus Woesearchaeota archaeon]|nr:MAG: hypothetical protein H6502_00475 [Candidatus Woesearchaeota archaeon]
MAQEDITNHLEDDMHGVRMAHLEHQLEKRATIRRRVLTYTAIALSLFALGYTIIEACDLPEQSYQSEVYLHDLSFELTQALYYPGS